MRRSVDLPTPLWPVTTRASPPASAKPNFENHPAATLDAEPLNLEMQGGMKIRMGSVRAGHE